MSEYSNKADSASSEAEFPASVDSAHDAHMWHETARQMAEDRQFYQGLVRQIGEMFGVAARTSDDGSVQEDVLALKVPELVAALVAECATLREQKDVLKEELELADADCTRLRAVVEQQEAAVASLTAEREKILSLGACRLGAPHYCPNCDNTFIAPTELAAQLATQAAVVERLQTEHEALRMRVAAIAADVGEHDNPLAIADKLDAALPLGSPSPTRPHEETKS